MKRYWIIFLSVLLLTLPCSVLAKTGNKIGVVDMQKFQQESKRFQKIKAGLQKKFQSLQQKLDKEKVELAKAEEDFKKQSMMLSLDAKEDKQKEVERKRRYYKYLYAEYTQEMKEAEIDARKKVGKEVEKIVGIMGEKGGYLLILEAQAPGLVYFNNALDITDEVAKAYDESAQ